MEDSPQSNVVRLSLRGVLLVLALLLLVGFAGGLAGSYWFRPALPPLTDKADQLVATVQEVTISPSKATAELVAEKQRSVLLLGREDGSRLTAVATGIVVTNDGIVAVPSFTGDGQGGLLAFDGDRPGVSLSFIGRDQVYGLTYFRLGEGVLTPLDLAQEDPPIGAQLVQLGRDGVSVLPVAQNVTIQRFRLPDESQPVGWQRLVEAGAGSGGTEDRFLVGSVLLGDDGALTALMTEDEGVAMPVSVVRESLQRLTRQEREKDALAEWGLELRYDFEYIEADKRNTFVVEVAGVEAGSAAAVAQLRPGDRILEVGDIPVTWETLVPQVFDTDAKSLTITRVRGDNTEDVVLTKGAAPSP